MKIALASCKSITHSLPLFFSSGCGDSSNRRSPLCRWCPFKIDLRL